MCLLIAVQSPVQASYFVAVGKNLSFAHSPDESLAGMLLSHLSKVLSERRCLMIEGSTRLRHIDILYRSALYLLSEDGSVIDHVLVAPCALNTAPRKRHLGVIPPELLMGAVSRIRPASRERRQNAG